jgi:hypothetical protein
MTLRLPAPVKGLAFTPDGGTLVTHDADNIRLWETK